MTARSTQRPLIATAPTRLDFGGGWTDVPPFPEERGGFVCNVAISRYATARVAPGAPRVNPLAPTAAIPGDAIVRAALARHGRTDLTATLASDFPVGAGLGGSSAAGVALVATLRAYAGDDVSSHEARDAIAEVSRSIEVEEMGIAGGRQDHYAAAHGGASGIAFGTTTIATPIALSDETTAALEQQCVVGYTGESRISATTITAVIDAYRARDARVVSALERMKSLAFAMRDALARGNIDELGALVNEHWAYQRTLHPAISTERIDALEQSVRNAGAIGLKALGASGGGCVMVFARAGEQHRVRDAMRPYADLLQWRVAMDGVTVREETGVMERLKREH